MSRYVLRRLVLLLPTLALITLLVFSIIRLLPGDIVTLMMSEQGYAGDKAKLEQMLGLDQPFYRQYVSYLGKALDSSTRSPPSLNGRPRQTLGWRTPSEAFARAVAMTA